MYTERCPSECSAAGFYLVVVYLSKRSDRACQEILTAQGELGIPIPGCRDASIYLSGTVDPSPRIHLARRPPPRIEHDPLCDATRVEQGEERKNPTPPERCERDRPAESAHRQPRAFRRRRPSRSPSYIASSTLISFILRASRQPGLGRRCPWSLCGVLVCDSLPVHPILRLVRRLQHLLPFPLLPPPLSSSSSCFPLSSSSSSSFPSSPSSSPVTSSGRSPRRPPPPVRPPVRPPDRPPWSWLIKKSARGRGRNGLVDQVSRGLALIPPSLTAPLAPRALVVARSRPLVDCRPRPAAEMDINSLLSPQDSAAHPAHPSPAPAPLPVVSSVSSSSSSSASASLSPHRTFRRPRSGSVRHAMTSSPLAQHVYAPSRLPDPSPPAMSPTAGPTRGGGGTGTGTPPANELPPPARQPSTPGMDTLADLASMQHHQPPRSAAPLLRSTESYESQLSPSTMYPHVNPVSHNTPTARASFDLALSDAPKEYARRDYADTSLAPEAQRQATQLFAHLQENPHAYESHVQFIRLLHAGFVNHVYPPDNPDVHGDPQKYDLLRDMRTAREEMDKLFALGEDLWAEWIQDESMLARTVEERISVMELCQRSVEEEYGSTKLWGIYGEWMLYLYNSAAGESGPGSWSEEDRLIGREVFSWQSVMDVWQRGAEATRWRIHDSHLVWDRFLDLSMQDLARAPTPDRVAQVRALFDGRLQTPHATWDQTFQLFSTFVSTYYNANYEDIMADTVARAAEAKARHAAREPLETRLQRAAESGDRTLEWTTFAEYLDWEVSRNRRKRLFSFDLANALYQRAVLRFPTDVNLWEDYITFLIDESMHGQASPSTIATLERATRHCPWSGSLWSQYLLSSEREGQPFTKIADIKHKATSTGLLDAGGMEEVLKVHTTWCSYLRRRAFLPDSTDEDLDVAEVGIRSAIESVQELGEKKYGKSYQGDPMFRLERIYIRYLSESGSWDSARETFKGLVGRRGSSYEFWHAATPRPTPPGARPTPATPRPC
ncbi:hypothetical protein VTN02DRAFT_173 [Thermoascus thermophilus]